MCDDVSTFGNALTPSNDLVEIVFSILVVTCGLLLFSMLIGNIQAWPNIFPVFLRGFPTLSIISSTFYNHLTIDMQSVQDYWMALDFTSPSFMNYLVSINLFSLTWNMLEIRWHFQDWLLADQWCVNCIVLQMFLHSVISKKGDMQLRVREMEWWMRRRQIPLPIRERVRRYERHRWGALHGIDEDEIISNMPEGLRKDIQRHLCISLVKQVLHLCQTPYCIPIKTICTIHCKREGNT